MNTEEIKNSLHRLQILVEGWHEGEVPAVERDLALEKLRRIYAELRFGSAEVAVPEPAEREDAAEPEVEVEFIMPEETEQDEQEIGQEEQAGAEAEAEAETSAEPQSVPAPESESQSVQQSAPESVPEQQPQSAQEVAVPQGDALFEDKDILVPRRTRRSVIMSLYGEAEQPQNESPQAETPRNEKPQSEVPKPQPTTDNKVLGEVLRTADKTLGDTIARPKDIAASAPVTSLRTAIGIADRFLLIRDLFDGDERAYERAIVAIDSFDNLDDCMVHIVENYSWRSESAGARLIMDLLQRKFAK